MDTAKGDKMKRRNVCAEAHSLRGGAGAGAHKNKGMRGEGKKGKGKSQRHKKHKGGKTC